MCFEPVQMFMRDSKFVIFTYCIHKSTNSLNLRNSIKTRYSYSAVDESTMQRVHTWKHDSLTFTYIPETCEF